jgi:hypothetical protein
MLRDLLEGPECPATAQPDAIRLEEHTEHEMRAVCLPGGGSAVSLPRRTQKEKCSLESVMELRSGDASICFEALTSEI